jgi:hypothetical protein
MIQLVIANILWYFQRELPKHIKLFNLNLKIHLILVVSCKILIEVKIHGKMRLFCSYL